MKKIISLMLFTVCSLTGLFAGEILEFPEKADWLDSTNLKALPGNVLEFHKGMVYSTVSVKALYDKTTVFSGEFRCKEPGQKVRLFFAVRPLDAWKRPITAYHVNTIPLSDTVLLSPVKKGDRFLHVRNGEKFKKGAKTAFDTKEDLSDLPNRNLSKGNVKKGEKLQDGSWHIHLTAPLTKEYPQGTRVRAHGNGPFQNAAIVDLTGTDWKKVEGRVKGVVKRGMGGRKWTPGSAYGYIVLYCRGKVPVQFRNIKCEIKD